MTWKEAFLRALFAGTLESTTAVRLRVRSWWDDDCEDVLVSVLALRDLGRALTAFELAKCLVALDYGFDEAADIAAQAAAPLLPEYAAHYAQELRALIGEVAA